MNRFLLLLLLLLSNRLHAQLQDDFTDGNLTHNPLWTGSNTENDFIIIDNKLRSNSSTANSNFYLSTENVLALNVQWELWLNLQFSTSGANYVDIYVVSDKADLKSSLINGYFIRIGNTDDEICLYKRSGTLGSSVKIIDGVNGSVGSSNNTVKVKLTRDGTGRFTLEREIVGPGSSYFTEGAITDLSYSTTSHFGIYIQQSTASFFLKHFFDAIRISPIVIDTLAPKVNSATALDSNTVQITYSEAIDSLTAKLALNYAINNEAGPILRVSTTADPASYHLKLASALVTGTYVVSTANIRDRNGNLIGANNTAVFNYTKPYIAKWGDIVITEIFADPTPQIDLPSVEFAEIYNRSNQPINLKHWKFADSGASASFPEVLIDAHTYLIVCAKSDTAEYNPFGKVIGLSPWPSLNNTGELLKLVSPDNITIDSVGYTDAWYRSPAKKEGGWSLERRDLMSRCEGISNWLASIDTTGGTPGRQNSVHMIGFDSLPLRMDSLKLVSDTTLKLHFNKPLNGTTLNTDNFVINPATSIIKKIVLESSYTEVIVHVNRPFEPGIEYQIVVASVRDCSGTAINTNSQLAFKRGNPKLIVEKPDTARLVITEIFADPSPEVGLPLAEFIEIHNPGKDTVDLANWSINDALTHGILQPKKILPGEYVILCPLGDTSQYEPYGRTIAVQPWPALNNSHDQITLRSFKNRSVDSVAYFDTWYRSARKNSGGWTLEKIDLNSSCINFFNWTASLDTTGGTPGKKNSVYTSKYDRVSLKVDSLKLISDTTVKLFFNRHLDSSILQFEHFNLTPENTIKRINADLEIKELTIFYEKQLLPGTAYQMLISNLKDCNGTPLSGIQQLSFKTNPTPQKILEKPDTAQLIITEVFADPSPEVGLPLSEFIEIYNPGSDTVDFTKWLLSDVTTKGIIATGSIKPGEYLILCPAADTLSFARYGKTRAVTPWPSLANSGDVISLKSIKQRLVDSVAYSDKWYRHPTKKNGGWSLERINIQKNSCIDFYNWTSSIDPSGGTPGRPNSNKSEAADQQLLTIDSIRHTSDSTVIISLNMFIDTAHLKPSYFLIDNNIGRATSLSFDVSLLKINLTFSRKFIEGVHYKLTSDSLADCGGNLISQDIHANFFIPIIPELAYPIVINEIFADPSPTQGLPEVEFVELFNPTEQTINLKGMSYGDDVLQHQFSSVEMAPGSYLILCPRKDTLQFVPFGKVLGLISWPTLSNEKDILVLRNNKGREIHRVAYNSTWYRDTKKKAGGYSLEMISAESVCVGSQNWKASTAPSGGTPGRENSVRNSLLPEPIKLSEALWTDSITLVLSFNKSIDSLTATSVLNYQINNGVGNPESAKPLSPNFDQVLLKFREPLRRGMTYKVEVFKLLDCTGSTIRDADNYQEFILTNSIGKNDILISEILFNPRANGVDFVEIYNNTQHVLDLKDLSIGSITDDTVTNQKAISLTQYLFKPGHYLALTSNPEMISREHNMTPRDSILKVALPPFNNREGSVVLMVHKQTIDRLDYSERMHFQLLKNFEGVSLERSNFYLNANEPGNFRSATAASGFATPGRKNSQANSTPLGAGEFSLRSNTFSPDNDGFEDLLQVSYHMPATGMIANVKIFNDQGILVRDLQKNHTLNSEGTLSWDGLNESGDYAGAGIYIVFAEIFDTKGNVKRFRRSFALAVKL